MGFLESRRISAVILAAGFFVLVGVRDSSFRIERIYALVYCVTQLFTYIGTQSLGYTRPANINMVDNTLTMSELF